MRAWYSSRPLLDEHRPPTDLRLQPSHCFRACRGWWWCTPWSQHSKPETGGFLSSRLARKTCLRKQNKTPTIQSSKQGQSSQWLAEPGPDTHRERVRCNEYDFGKPGEIHVSSSKVVQGLDGVPKAWRGEWTGLEAYIRELGTPSARFPEGYTCEDTSRSSSNRKTKPWSGRTSLRYKIKSKPRWELRLCILSSCFFERKIGGQKRHLVI